MGSAPNDPMPAIVQAIESKCTKTYQLDPGENLWLLLLGSSSTAPLSTFILPLALEPGRLSRLTDKTLSCSKFSCVYHFCELTVPGPVLYAWESGGPWQKI